MGNANPGKAEEDFAPFKTSVANWHDRAGFTRHHRCGWDTDVRCVPLPHPDISQQHPGGVTRGGQPQSHGNLSRVASAVRGKIHRRQHVITHLCDVQVDAFFFFLRSPKPSLWQLTTSAYRFSSLL